MLCMVRCAVGLHLGMPSFFAVGLHTVLACRSSDHCGNSVPSVQQQRQQLCPAYGNTKPDSIATHAFCVRVRFKLCKSQAVAQPSASLARGSSRPSVPSQMRSPLSQRELQRGLQGALSAHRRRRIPRTGMEPTP